MPCPLNFSETPDPKPHLLKSFAGRGLGSLLKPRVQSIHTLNRIICIKLTDCEHVSPAKHLVMVSTAKVVGGVGARGEWEV